MSLPQNAEPCAHAAAGTTGKDERGPARDTGPEQGAPLFVACYLAACLALFVALGVASWAEAFQVYVPGLKRGAFQLYLYITSAGGLGAVIYCVRALYKHVSLGDYDPEYVYWYVFRPWVGSVLGMVTYFLIVGGLLVFNTGGPSDSVQAKALFVAVAFLAGFSSNEFVMKMNAVAKALFGVGNSAGEEATAAGEAQSPEETKPPSE